jgi:hypothetical protein
VVFVAGAKVVLGDEPFALFLRLVVQLFKDIGGVVSTRVLIKERYLRADSEYQALGRLRELFGPALLGLSDQDFIERPRPKTLRLSTHRAVIRYNKPVLLENDNATIRSLAKRLPDDHPEIQRPLDYRPPLLDDGQ